MENNVKIVKKRRNSDNVRRGSACAEKPLKYGPMPTFPNQRIWARVVLILGVLIVVYFTSKSGQEVVLGRQKDVIQQRSQNIDCPDEVAKELLKYPDCVSKKCGRTITDKLVSAAESNSLLDIAKRGLALGGSDGGASILDLHSGALSFGKSFLNIYSLERAKDIFKPGDFVVFKVVKTKIQQAIAFHFGIDANSLFLTHPTFFSRITSKEAATVHDEYWHPHVDKDTYESFHYTSLLYLSDYGHDFDGGRFVFIDKDNVNRTIEPRKGRVNMFTSGSENLHFVEKVTKGTRYAITVSFTCDKNFAIPDPSLDNVKHLV